MTDITSMFAYDSDKRVWEATNIMVDSSFNLHLEMVDDSKLVIKATTVSGADKALVFSASVSKVFEGDFADKVYPKYIDILAYNEVKKACITEAE